MRCQIALKNPLVEMAYFRGERGKSGVGMTDATAEIDEEEEAPKKKSKMGLIIGLVLAVAGGGGGFFAAQSGLLPFGGGGGDEEKAEAEIEEHDSTDVAFVPVEPLIISLGARSNNQHLRFHAQLEVQTAYVDEVTKLLPRVSDVMNSYLRAVEISQLQDPTALFRIRSHLLRRVQIVTGGDKVRDLLVMEFVLT